MSLQQGFRDVLMRRIKRAGSHKFACITRALQQFTFRIQHVFQRFDQLLWIIHIGYDFTRLRFGHVLRVSTFFRSNHRQALRKSFQQHEPAGLFSRRMNQERSFCINLTKSLHWSEKPNIPTVVTCILQERKLALLRTGNRKNFLFIPDQMRQRASLQHAIQAF